MGLDMYLYARRSFEPESDEAQKILQLAEVSLEDLTPKPDDEYPDDRDLYLPRWEWAPEPERNRAIAITEAAGLLPLATDDSMGGFLAVVDGRVTVSIACLYWRKANAIHSWFVENCQDGIDECQYSPVGVEQLAQLRSTCVDALAAFSAGDIAKASEIMSPVDGFFFGNTDINEWWAEDQAHTVKEIERVINTAIRLGGNIDFIYHSSW